MLLIRKIDIYRYAIPMVPFTIATGTMDTAQNMLVYIHTGAGLTGIGECSAFPMIAGETQDTCLALARDFARLWLGKDAADVEGRLSDLDRWVAGNHTAKSAFDMALYDLAAKAAGVPLYQYLGGTYFEPESDLTIGIGAPEDMAAQAVQFVQEKGASILKIKLGKDPETDVERVRKIRSVVGDRIALRLDANQGWDFEGAVRALTEMQELNIEFCEQPLHRLQDEKMPSLRRISKIPLMADESVFSHHDAERISKQMAFDYVNIKLSKAGGIFRALQIHEVCQKAGLANMLGGMLESRLGLSANVHLALSCSNIRYYDLDTCLLGHLEDPVTGGVRFEGMKLVPPHEPGIGAGIDETYLRSCERISVA